jgi:hypothetical protein
LEVGDVDKAAKPARLESVQKSKIELQRPAGRGLIPFPSEQSFSVEGSAMRSKLLTTMAVAAALVVAIQLTAQAQFGPPKPGAEHKVLDPLVGSWDAKIKMWLEPGKEPSNSEGKMTRKWIMDGLFLEEKVDSKFMGMTFKGLGLNGYDTAKKKYVGTWIDTMGTGIMILDGTYDEKTKTFTLIADEVDPQGKKSKFRSSTKIMAADHHVQEMFSTPEGGKEMKVMEIHYTKVPESAPPAKR